eukprot:TRINITY_DN1827_c0_g1_i1.p1 TRINITY_DN1827_c0_g1~~TRINITY_DN1827_c0_g1_i1.p1  ORF type:complete len:649 (-),score=104.29 TRINITY_DN1827_c0_g1_i1:162-2108(-)
MSNDYLSVIGMQGDDGFDGEGSGPGMDMPEEFEIDEDLSVLERVRKYAKSDQVLQRLYIMREMNEAAREVGFDDTRAHIIPVLEEVVTDPEPAVRQCLMEQIPAISRFVIEKGGDRGYVQVLHILLPLVAEMTTDRDPQVRVSAVDSLEAMATLIHHEDLEPYLLPIIKSLANDSTEEEHRVEAAQLLHNVSPILGAELTQQVVLPFVARLSEDSVFRVRKAVASHIGNIAKTVGVEATTQHLLPIFVALSQDEIWGVRKGCAESLVQMAGCVSPIERYSNLIEVFERLAEDPSRWVVSAAFQNLGPFIATFEGFQVTPKLLRYYTSMVSDTSSSSTSGAGAGKYGGDTEIITFCAFNFPAVLFTVGSGRWSELSDSYFTLCNDLQWKVRRTLSYSLHEIAKILGTATTETSLLPSFDLFLRDLDEVRVGVITHLSEFLEVLTPETRERYFNIISEVLTDSNWRFRRLLSKQIGHLAKLFSPEITSTKFLSLAFSLVTDPVAKVRTAAASGMGTLLVRLWELEGGVNENVPESATSKVLALASSNYFGSRQIYVHICEHLLTQVPSHIFETIFLPPLLGLTHDEVANVRFALARLLSQKLVSYDNFATKGVLVSLDKLKTDKDRDVLYFSNLAPSLSENLDDTSEPKT